ncbi:Protein of unknown function [Propionibacterium freudenreichii]|uniref:Uncharacterized protein n=1 Tax=Propionibacterium freudenreichii subsp. freudenreichii TaxID=66712 RepID=A0A0B7P0D8_PROFF|nr:Protein of unknown function [Propionibacterium freudenreichii]CEP26738.1 Protein of unknown function [Propionibacterium freudenreichii subsp. freudenreichii]CEG92471.1 Protein of unknown function [Propionibacterium freudenreichii]CEG99484.1 Protein of unknown function [Propionibacterium freudenreichii]CEH04305.1 Protein of unknown function [Propionibacterium freudenreichii]
MVEKVCGAVTKMICGCVCFNPVFSDSTGGH